MLDAQLPAQCDELPPVEGRVVHAVVNHFERPLGLRAIRQGCKIKCLFKKIGWLHLHERLKISRHLQ